MTLTPAGMKKNDMFDSRKSLFCRMCSTFRIPVHSAASRRSIAAIDGGKGKGRMALSASPARHVANTIAIWARMFIAYSPLKTSWNLAE